MLRYAVLHHTDGLDPDHFDLLIEREVGRGDLATWRLPGWPVLAAGEAIQLRDHRRAFLVYEGELTLSRGRVRRVAEGVATAEFGSELVQLQLDGTIRLCLRLVRERQWTIQPGG